MRKVAGLSLAGLGIVLIVAAVLLPTYVSGQIVKFPLDEHTTATLAGTGVSYFSQVKLTFKTGVSVRATYTIKGTPRPAVPRLPCGTRPPASGI